MVDDWYKFNNQIVSSESVGRFAKNVINFMDRDDGRIQVDILICEEPRAGC